MIALTNDAPAVLIAEEAIRQRVRELAAEVSADHADAGEVILVCVLKGAFIFAADLARALTIPHRIEFIAVSSYGEGTVQAESVRLILDTRAPIAGRAVVILEDIVDSGHTLEYLNRLLGARRPASLKTCSLLRKPDRLAADVDVDYVGFDIPDVWVVGYGLDLGERHRTLPYIGQVDAAG